MQLQKPKIPYKYRPREFDIVHEDLDLIIVDKKPGILSVAALWNKTQTVHSVLNNYIRKGNSRSSKVVYVVHRLDQATSGLMVFAKSESAQQFLKSNWVDMKKKYLTIVHGHPPKNSGVVQSYLDEDEDYHVHSSQDSGKGALAKTEYQVVKKTDSLSILKVNLITGKKNQIRVHMADIKTPIVGDTKYGPKASKYRQLMLHSYRLQLVHPHTKEAFEVLSQIPERFQKIVDCNGLEL